MSDKRKPILITCPSCGADNHNIRHYQQVWIYREDVTLLSDGTIDSYGCDSDDDIGREVKEYFACEDCGSTWKDGKELSEHYMRNGESALRERMKDEQED